MRGVNEPQAQWVPKTNANGPNANAFDWDGFSDEDPVRGAYRGNHS
jgi:hypothetical protein